MILKQQFQPIPTVTHQLELLKQKWNKKEKKRQKAAIKPNQNILNSETFFSNIQVYMWKVSFLQD